MTSKLITVGSSAGLEAVRRGECDLAGIHLLDPETGEYNRPFLTDEMVLLEGYGRSQGIVYRRGDPRFEGRTIDEIVATLTPTSLPERPGEGNCVMVNRNQGSGTRILIDRLLAGNARAATPSRPAITTPSPPPWRKAAPIGAWRSNRSPARTTWGSFPTRTSTTTLSSPNRAATARPSKPSSNFSPNAQPSSACNNSDSASVARISEPGTGSFCGVFGAKCACPLSGAR